MHTLLKARHCFSAVFRRIFGEVEIARVSERARERQENLKNRAKRSETNGQKEIRTLANGMREIGVARLHHQLYWNCIELYAVCACVCTDVHNIRGGYWRKMGKARGLRCGSCAGVSNVVALLVMMAVQQKR